MTPQNVIKKFMGALADHGFSSTYSSLMLDSAVSAASRFTSIQEVRSSLLEDQAYCLDAATQAVANAYPDADLTSDYYKNLISETTAQLFLKNYCGINLDNTDTGAITGSDANLTLTTAMGYNELNLQAIKQIYGSEATLSSDGQTLTIGTGTEKNASTVVDESFTAPEFDNSDTFTRNGLTIHLRGISDDGELSDTTPITFDELDDIQKTILAGLYKWWAQAAITLNTESYGIDFNKASVVDMDLYFHYDTEGFLAGVLHSSRQDDGVATKLYLSINTEPYQNLTTDDTDGVSDWGYLDRTLAHEFTHALMATNVNFFVNLPVFIKEGIAELTHGIDDESYESLMEIAGDPDKLAATFDLTNTEELEPEYYVGGYIFMRYFARQAAMQTIVLPAFGEIEPVAVNFNDLEVSAGNVLYVDTLTENPTVQIAADLDTFYTLDDPYKTLLSIGSVNVDDGGDLYYMLDNDLIKQVITTGGNVSDVYQLNANATLTGSADYDGVQMLAGSNSVSTGAGDDYIEVSGQYATIGAGTGNDDIIVWDGSHNLIDLGDGDNQLQLFGAPYLDDDGFMFSNFYANSLYGGAGADTITNPYVRYFDADGVETGDENDNAYTFIANHNDYDIDLGDGNNEIFLTKLTDSNIKLGAGNDYLSFVQLQNVNIELGGGEDTVVLGSSGGDFSLKGFGADDTIELGGKPTELAIEDGKIVAGTATIAGISSIASMETAWTTAAKKISYTSATLAGAVLDADEGLITYTAGGNETLFTINGLSSTVGVSLGEGEVTISADALANRTADTITISDGYKLVIDGATDDTLTITDAQDAVFENGTYTAAITAEYYEVADGAIVYHAATGGQQFSITGIKDSAELDTDIVVGEGGKVTLKSSALPESLAAGDKIILKDSKSGDGVNYTLTLDEEISQDSSTHKGGWSGEKGTFTYTEDYKLAYWKKSSNTYTYNAQSGGHKYQISGLNESITADNFTSKTVSVKGGTFKILSADILSTTDEAEINGVTGIGDIAAQDGALQIDKKVPAPKEIKESFKASKNVYTYTATGTSAGWSLNDGKIVYAAQVGGTQFKLSGIKSSVKLDKGVSVADGVVKVSAAALNGTKEKDGAIISLTGDGYELQLDSEIAQAAQVVEGTFTAVAKGKATYTAEHTPSYYEATDDNTYTYRKQDAAQVMTISNLKSDATTDDLSGIDVAEADGKFTVTFNDTKALTTKAPSISGVTYTVAVADSLKPAVQDSDWTVKSANATLKADTSAGYDVAKNKVVYSGVKSGKAQIVLSGITSGATLDAPEDGKVQLDATKLGTNTLLKTNDGTYAIELTGDMSDKKFTGSASADKLIITATNAAVNPGKGNDSISVSGAGAVVQFAANDGLDTITYAEDMQISLSGETKPTGVTLADTNLIISYGKKDSLTVTNFEDSLIVANKNDTVTIAADKLDLSESLTFGKNSVTIAANYVGSVSSADDVYVASKLSSVTSFDASKTTGAVYVGGNAKANTLYGGAQTTLAGGGGKDVFVYDGGEVTIADYEVGEKISVTGTASDYRVDGDDVLISFGDSNSLQISDGAGKAITLVEGKKSTVNVYSAEGLFNGGKTAVTTSGSFDASTGCDKLSTIISGLDTGVELNGNAKANVIIGGAGDDTLTGASGKDAFVYTAGADVITDYADGDKVSLATGISLTGAEVSGKDVTVSLSNGGTIKLEGVGSNKVTFLETTLNAKGKETSKSATYIFGDGAIFNANQSAVTVSTDFDAAAYTNLATIKSSSNSGVELNGNAKANVIIGGAGDDTLWGSTKNDTLTGGEGADTFVYKPGDGKDVITDYATGDLLTIDGGTFTKAAFSKGTLTLTVDGGSIALKNVTTSTEFDINGDTYEISGTKLAKK